MTARKLPIRCCNFGYTNWRKTTANPLCSPTPGWQNLLPPGRRLYPTRSSSDSLPKLKNKKSLPPQSPVPALLPPLPAKPPADWPPCLMKKPDKPGSCKLPFPPLCIGKHNCALRLPAPSTLPHANCLASRQFPSNSYFQNQYFPPHSPKLFPPYLYPPAAGHNRPAKSHWHSAPPPPALLPRTGSSPCGVSTLQKKRLQTRFLLPDRNNSALPAAPRKENC